MKEEIENSRNYNFSKLCIAVLAFICYSYKGGPLFGFFNEDGEQVTYIVRVG